MGAAALGAAGFLVTRPVLVRLVAGFSSFFATGFFGAAFLGAAAAFLGAALAAGLAASFFAAGFLAVAAAGFFSLAAAGLGAAVFFASLVPPEGPVQSQRAAGRAEGRWDGMGRGHTLRLLEDALLDAGLQGLVEERVEHVLRDGDVVVALDVLLELLAAGGGSAGARPMLAARGASLPGTIAILELSREKTAALATGSHQAGRDEARREPARPCDGRARNGETYRDNRVGDHVLHPNRQHNEAKKKGHKMRWKTNLVGGMARRGLGLRGGSLGRHRVDCGVMGRDWDKKNPWFEVSMDLGSAWR